MESLAALEQTFIQMKTDISLQALWKALQYLQIEKIERKDRKSVPHGEEEKEGRKIAGFKSFVLELRLYNTNIAQPPSTTNT